MQKKTLNLYLASEPLCIQQEPIMHTHHECGSGEIRMSSVVAEAATGDMCGRKSKSAEIRHVDRLTD